MPPTLDLARLVGTARNYRLLAYMESCHRASGSPPTNLDLCRAVEQATATGADLADMLGQLDGGSALIDGSIFRVDPTTRDGIRIVEPGEGLSPYRD